MGFFDKLTAFFSREAKDLADMAEAGVDRFDEKLSAAEAELQKTPAEKVRDLSENSKALDSRLEAIVDKAEAAAASQSANQELSKTNPNSTSSNPSGAGSQTVPNSVAKSARFTSPNQSSSIETEADIASRSESNRAASGPKGDSAHTASSNEGTASADGAGPVTSDVSNLTKPGINPVTNQHYVKTPAQLKYERARAAADELLEELRSELEIDEN